MKICTNKFASGNIFVCVSVLLKQKIYIVKHIWLMRAGKL